MIQHYMYKVWFIICAFLSVFLICLWRFSGESYIEIKPICENNALSNASEVWLISISSNEKEGKILNYVYENKGWIYRDESLVALKDAGPLTLQINRWDKVKIGFMKHSWSGLVEVTDASGSRIFDLFDSDYGQIDVFINTDYYIGLFFSWTVIVAWIALLICVKSRSFVYEKFTKPYAELIALRGCIVLILICVSFYVNGEAEIQEMLPFENIDLIQFVYKNGWLLSSMLLMISGFLFFARYKNYIQTEKGNYCEFIIKFFINFGPLVIVTHLVMLIGQLFYKASFGRFWLNDDLSLLDVLGHLVGVNALIDMEYTFGVPAHLISILFISCSIAYIFMHNSKTNRNGRFLCLTIIGISVLVELYPSNNVVEAIFGLFIDVAPFFLGGIINLFWDTLTEKGKTYFSNGCIVWLFVCWILYSAGFELEPLRATVNICLFGPLLIFILGNEKIKQLFHFRFFRYLGEISWSLFLWNIPFQIVILNIIALFNITIDFFSPIFWIVQLILQISWAEKSKKCFEVGKAKYLETYFNLLFLE